MDRGAGRRRDRCRRPGDGVARHHERRCQLGVAPTDIEDAGAGRQTVERIESETGLNIEKPRTDRSREPARVSV